MRKIFICYRRDDSEGEAGRLHDDLVGLFGEASVFMDVTGIDAGRDFREAIDANLATCGVLLAIISKNWLEIKNEAGQRRLDDMDDFVRLEIASALKRGVPVIPVLVRGAKVPHVNELPRDIQDLVYRSGAELTHARWASDLQLLVKALAPYSEDKKSALGQDRKSAAGSGLILAGDIGGTHTRIALFEETDGRLAMSLERVYPSREYKGLDEILRLFLGNEHVSIDCACFGIAGPVLNDQVSTPNLPWVVEALKLAHQIGVGRVSLINDLMAHATGIDDLTSDDFVSLNNIGQGEGNAALIAAGTGLGEAGIYWNGVHRQPFPCEGGHCDFAPRNEMEIALLEYLLEKFGRVSYERIVSGQGLHNIYDFLRDSGREQEPPWLKQELQNATDPVALISHYGLEGKAPICEHTLDIFVGVYGAEAGNLALKLMATGGVFVSGGIAAKILPRLTAPAFMQSFISKGRLQPVMETIPVKVIVNDRVGLIGAARYASLTTSRGSVSDRGSPVGRRIGF